MRDLWYGLSPGSGTWHRVTGPAVNERSPTGCGDWKYLVRYRDSAKVRDLLLRGRVTHLRHPGEWRSVRAVPPDDCVPERRPTRLCSYCFPGGRADVEESSRGNRTEG